MATIPGIVSPLLTGYIVETGEDTRVSWQIVFYIAAGIYLFGCVIYWFFASGEVQQWAIVAEEEHTARQNARKSQEGTHKQAYTNETLEMNEH